MQGCKAARLRDCETAKSSAETWLGGRKAKWRDGEVEKLEVAKWAPVCRRLGREAEGRVAELAHCVTECLSPPVWQLGPTRPAESIGTSGAKLGVARARTDALPACVGRRIRLIPGGDLMELIRQDGPSWPARTQSADTLWPAEGPASHAPRLPPPIS